MWAGTRTGVASVAVMGLESIAVIGIENVAVVGIKSSWKAVIENVAKVGIELIISQMGINFTL